MLGLVVCGIFLSMSPAPSASDPAHDALVRFADRILANQQTDGAIVMGDPSFPPFQVVPYFGNLAGDGLMRAYEITNDPQYLNAAQSWTFWYLQHQNADGTIYDFTGTVGHWTPTYDYDSTDSYASTFLEMPIRSYCIRLPIIQLRRRLFLPCRDCLMHSSLLCSSTV
jgi:hypothetical protein